MRAAVPFIAAFLLSGLPAAAQLFDPTVTINDKFSERIDIGISTNEIAISSDFSGADITVFGAIDGADELLLATFAYDIVVSLEGPRISTTVRRKERVAGIWINRHSIRFEPIPASYSMSSTRPLEGIAPMMELASRDIGINNIRLVPTGGIGDGSRVAEFREALRRIKQTGGLYQRDPTGVRFISKALFRASVRLPANIPVGLHEVRAVLYKNGEFVMEKVIPLRVVKTGLEQLIFNYAHSYGLAYGVFAVFLAAVTGWLSSLIFRKD
ncbi:membrane protein [Hoeflea sp. BAL378]|uniref:TIGR02186 family protein n=1 Tax=Hoeflea sp. BAL378 TaxID=1547437 RepID=UPI00051361ED|nr:TIGR02186 family protein [Hoeflea sp. BAL378]KGF68664.1 membrane protein [Hoeflea sp. BAL378]